MKANFRIASALAMSVIGLTAGANKTYSDEAGIYYELREDGTAVITNTLGPIQMEENVVIPDQVTVDGITYLITELGSYSFYQNEYMVTFTCGSNMKTIDDYAFFSCPTLTVFNANDKLEKIGDSAFYLSTSLNEVKLNEGLKIIAPSAFYATNNLYEISFPSTVALEANPFMGCFTLQAIHVAEESEYLDVLDGCLVSKDHKTLYTVPVNRKEMNKIEIPAGIEIMTDNSARSLDYADELVLPASLKKMGNNAISHNKFTSLEIPASVEEIGHGNLSGCLNLTNLTVAEGNTHFKVYDGYLLSADGKRLVASLLKNGQITIPEGVEYIEAFTFVLMDKVTDVKMPDTVKETGVQSFSNMYGLKNVTISKNLEKLGMQTFADNNQMNDFPLPAGLKVIGHECFSQCKSVRQAVLPEGLTEIGSFAYFACENLNKVSIPSTVKKWGDYSFYNCSKGIEYVVIGEEVTAMGEYTFSFAPKLKKIVLPKNMKVIPTEAFIYTGLEEIVWPDNVEEIGQHALMATQFESLSIPESVKQIGPKAISWMPNLKTCSLPATVTSLGMEVFQNNEKMTDLYISAIVPPEVDTDLFGLYDTVNGYETVTLHVIDENIAKAYREAPVWSKFANIKGDMSGVNEVSVDEGLRVVKILDIDGNRRAMLEKGVNIVIYNDGSRAKVMK